MGNFYQYVYDARLLTLIRFGAWEAILREPIPDTALRYSLFLHHFARGMAFSRLTRTGEAERELGILRLRLQDAALKASYDPFSDAYSAGLVAEAILSGVLAEGKGELGLARVAFERGVKAEDALVYDEPRDWLLPARQYLGALFLKTGDNAGAVAVFRRDLEINPLNGWALTGLAQAYTALKDRKALEKVNKDLAIAWQMTDREIKTAVY
jgi:tetratricopeptide (TPR) repeat protein